WPLGRLAEQTIVVPVDERDVAAVRAEVSAGAGGILLFGTSAPSDLGTQLHALETFAPGGVAPFVMTDEEGGAVQRMANIVGFIPSARQMAATMSPAQIEQLAYQLAPHMHAAGVTMDIAPVLDVAVGPGPNILDPDGSRYFTSVGVIAAAVRPDFIAE